MASSVDMFVRSFAFAALLFGLLATPVFGQDEVDRQALPDIAPRTVEIRGQLEINFPALERQPLSGFNPPPRMVDMADRVPYLEPYRQGAADLPPSPLQAPTAPALARLEGIEQRMGQLEARAGRYLSRYLDARIEHAFRPEMAVTGRLQYRGRDGHEPFEFDPDAGSAADDLNGRVDLHLFGSNLRGGVGLDGYHASYEMYGAASSFTAPALNPFPARTGGHLRASGWLRTTTSGPVDAGVRARLSGTSFDTDACPDERSNCVADRFTRSQQTLSLDGDAEVDIGGRTAFAQAAVSMSGVDGDALVGADLVTADVGAGAVVMQSRTMSLRGGARLLYAGSSGYADVDEYSMLYLSPDMRLDLYPGTGIQLFAENRPSIEHASLADIHRVNPYVVSRPALESEIRTVDARAGARLFRGPASVNLEAGVIVAPQYRFFERGLPEGGYASGVSEIVYDDARIIHVGGDVSFMVGGIATANAGITWRSGRLTDLDADIPNFGPLKGHAMISVPLAANTFVLSATARYESARYRDLAQTRRIGDYAAFDLRGTYRINHMIGIVAAIENISAGYLERWDGYPEPPAIISGGLRLSW